MEDGPPNSAADAAMIRRVANQLMDTWKMEQAVERKEARRWFSGNIGGWLAAAALAMGAMAAVANTHDLARDANDRSTRNETSIAVMKESTSDRLARIETKLDLIIEERKGTR